MNKVAESIKIGKYLESMVKFGYMPLLILRDDKIDESNDAEVKIISDALEIYSTLDNRIQFELVDSSYEKYLTHCEERKIESLDQQELESLALSIDKLINKSVARSIREVYDFTGEANSCFDLDDGDQDTRI